MPISERGKGQRSHQDMTLLLLLVLAASLAGRVLSDVIPTEDSAFTTVMHSPGDEDRTITDENGLSGEGEDFNGLRNPIVFTGEPTGIPPNDTRSNLLNPLAIIIPLLLLLLLVVAISVAVFICSRRRAKQHSGAGDMREDEILHGSDTEKVPMPMFEDDVPSVLELEMEDLEKWMVKDTGRICVDSAGDEA
ncbi:transmembrane protein 154 isoform X1 [Conger conger]|uniref:transmembrane protein 154 isoform X1 n=1 Tax=Conger conger TaxID=82655 RepID=UPI002A59BFF7|nr:transmembrane protein 154 isoform X1 [Conger conger]XP_061100312.1 transmembrane protein 154 isoform X1 [Conger conger]